MTAGNDDFHKALAEYGMDADTARRASENTTDMVDMPAGTYKFRVADSAIEGQGVVAIASIAEHETVGPARINGRRTLLGRYTNHAKVPNALMVLLADGDVILVASTAIECGAEVTIDYRQVARDVQNLPRTA